jgi:hypothetical protein
MRAANLLAIFVTAEKVRGDFGDALSIFSFGSHDLPPCSGTEKGAK